jgi:hypothetical protein
LGVLGQFEGQLQLTFKHARASNEVLQLGYINDFVVLLRKII